MNKSLLDVDVRKVLEQVTAKYGLKLPKKVVTIDYGGDVGDLYVRFHHADSTEGEATADGKVVVQYDKKGKIAELDENGLANVLKRLNFLAQTKTYLFWNKQSR